jgi:hypothetical protein
MLAELRAQNDYLPNAREVIQNYCDTCVECNTRLVKSGKHIVKNPICPSKALEHVQIDCVEYTKDDFGKIYLSNMIDLFSKFGQSVRTNQFYILLRNH